MIVRSFKSIRRKIAKWFRSAGQTPRGRLYSGSHSAFGRTFSIVQLTSGRRPYLLYLPENYSAAKRFPMIVMMHGCKQDAHTFAAATRMNGLADRDNFIVLYPEQRRLANAFRCWNWFSRSAQKGGGEAEILCDMVRTLANEHNVDLARIYIAGLSAGASMATNLAICHADVFAACAFHSGLMFGAATSTGEALNAMRNGSRHDPEETGRHAFAAARGKADAIPVLVIHGDCDSTVHPVNADQIVAQFEVLNSLLANETSQQVDRLQMRTGSKLSAGGYQYQTTNYLCAERLLIQKVSISGLGHAWSGGSEEYPYNDANGPSASEMICDFFAEHGLRDASVRPRVTVAA